MKDMKMGGGMGTMADMQGMKMGGGKMKMDKAHEKNMPMMRPGKEKGRSKDKRR